MTDLLYSLERLLLIPMHVAGTLLSFIFEFWSHFS